MSDLDAALTLAVRLADAARPIAARHFRSGLAIDHKADTTPVTEADRAVERQLRAMIEETFPDHGILGEEHGAVRLEARSVWVIDPIDGTKGFVTGKPLFGTLIAMLRDGAPRVGVIEVPALGERWLGIEGQPTTFNGRAVTCRACVDVRDAWMYSSTPYMFQGSDAQAFDRLQAQTREPMFGADCYAYGLLANGTVDLVCEAMMQPYDYCALVPVVEGAGGVITDWQGAPLGLGSDGRVLAAGDARTHAAALALLAG